MKTLDNRTLLLLPGNGFLTLLCRVSLWRESTEKVLYCRYLRTLTLVYRGRIWMRLAPPTGQGPHTGLTGTRGNSGGITTWMGTQTRSETKKLPLYSMSPSPVLINEVKTQPSCRDGVFTTGYLWTTFTFILLEFVHLIPYKFDIMTSFLWFRGPLIKRIIE